MQKTRGRLHALPDLLRSDVVGGFLLISGAVAALLWANSPFGHTYEALRTFSFGPQSLNLHLSVQAWVSDGLLAVFFFIVGNELKQEFVHGELRNPRRAMLPIIAAFCGMAVPALIYAGINFSRPETLHGWGIPMATDIAFAVAILAVVGRYLPPALRIFLLTLAIVDDLGAIVVIAVFYTADLSYPPLLGAAALLSLFGFLQRGKGPAATLNTSPIPNWVVYLPLAAMIWALMHASGVHATIAGVAMGLLMRTVPLADERRSPSHRVEDLLAPWSSGLVLPVFALLAAGVVFTGGLGAVFTDSAAVGIMAGLVAGKVIGITGGSWLITKLTSAELSPSLSWIDITGMSLLAGVGFTVSLLITELSFTDPVVLAHAKAGVLIASLVATVLAGAVLSVRNGRYRRTALPADAVD